MMVELRWICHELLDLKEGNLDQQMSCVCLFVEFRPLFVPYPLKELLGLVYGGTPEIHRSRHMQDLCMDVDVCH